MISKVEHCKPQNDNYGRLANYIADASHEGEKALMAWCAGCADDEDYAFSIREVVDTQGMNTRTTKEKTYHLIISFRPEDESKLNTDVYKAIEERFALALGFGEHQRHCGVHKNTGNLHMHIAYNMIHPEKFSRHEPYRDFWKRDQVCRELEQEFGLVVDNGRGQKTTDLEAGAARMESHTGHTSFESYAKSHKTDIMQEVATVSTWEEIHIVFAKYGMEILPHGNGLVIRDRNNPKKAKHAMKASVLDRSLSKKKLEDRFGVYHRPLKKWPEQCSYEVTPVHRAQERGDLFWEYNKGIEERKVALAIIKADFELEEGNIAQKWAKERDNIFGLPLNRAAKYRLIKLAKLREAEEKLNAKKEMYSKKEEVTSKIPYSTWIKFLQQKAEQGNEVALAILRSREIKIDTEKHRNNSNYVDTRLQGLQKRKDILTSDLSHQGKKTLVNVVAMQEVDPTVKHTIDKKGTLIFNFESGHTIRDNGKAIFFAEELADMARAYAQKKWGKNITMDNGVFKFQKVQSQRLGMGR